jgi:ABC-type oligopeptide transport system substrate-binding subunit
MFQIGWIADYPDPENFLDVLFHSQSAENHTAYNNSAVDALLEEARVEGNLSARLAIYQDIEQTIVTEAAWLPLYFGQNYCLVKPWVKGFSPSPMVIPLLKDVWIER